jgi:hypothetical protein
MGVYSPDTSFVPKASNSVVLTGCTPPCWVSKYHLTVVGPFSIVPSNSIFGIAPTHRSARSINSDQFKGRWLQAEDLHDRHVGKVAQR